MKIRFDCHVLVFSVTLTHFASAYCRTTTCAQSDPPSECSPGQLVQSCQMAGIPLFWPNPCISFSVQKDGSKKLGISATQLEDAVRVSFDTWQNAECPEGGRPSITIETYPQVECAESRYNSNDGNQNVWRFRDDDWPYGDSGDRALAMTLVSFNPKTGEIYDVDVELNSFAQTFALGVNGEGYDLQSVAQHEAGHFLGLANSADTTATMWGNYNGAADVRTLELDDKAGICAAYPPVATLGTSCDAEPRHGFSTLCFQPRNVDAGVPETDAGGLNQGTPSSGANESCSFVAGPGARADTHHCMALLAAVAGMVTCRRMQRKRGATVDSNRIVPSVEPSLLEAPNPLAALVHWAKLRSLRGRLTAPEAPRLRVGGSANTGGRLSTGGPMTTGGSRYKGGANASGRLSTGGTMKPVAPDLQSAQARPAPQVPAATEALKPSRASMDRIYASPRCAVAAPLASELVASPAA